MSNRILKLSIATIVAAGLIGAVALMPRESLASGPAKVARAFSQVTNYTVRSYAIENGKRTLVSETKVEGSTRTTIYYGPDGKPLEAAPPEIANEEEITKRLRALPSRELVDPQLLGQIVGSSSRSVEVNMDGKTVQLPPGHSVSVEGITGDDVMVIGGGGGVADAAYLRELLSREGIWKVERAGAVDRYRLADGNDDIQLDVDPATSLPKKLRLEMTASAAVEDEFHYGAMKP